MKTTLRGSQVRIATFTGLTLALAAGAAHAEAPALERHDELTHPRTSPPHHVRMALELAGIFAVGHEWYWRDNGKPNEVDWQLPNGTPAVEAKLTSAGAWRFDGNEYDINALGHPGFGMLTHFLARENGYGIGESFLISTIASGTWETFLEWREYGSLNDMAMTSTAGVPLGETAYQMVNHVRETRFELRGGVGSENGASFAVVGARGELDRIPSVGDGSFRGGRHVSFAAEMPTDAQGVRSVAGGAKTTVAGYYQNRATSTLVAGISAEFDYKKQAERQEREWDLLTAVAAGPSIDYAVRHRGVSVNVGTDLYADFGMLKSEAFTTWRAAHPTMAMRNVMANREHPYYFGLGATVDPRINVAYGGYFAGAKVSTSLYSSLDGADRDQEMLTTKTHFSDRDTNAEAAVGYEHSGVSVVLDGRVHHRSGTAEDVTSSTGERTAMITVGMRN